jgi:hypothetical protein
MTDGILPRCINLGITLAILPMLPLTRREWFGTLLTEDIMQDEITDAYQAEPKEATWDEYLLYCRANKIMPSLSEFDAWYTEEYGEFYE